MAEADTNSTAPAPPAAAQPPQAPPPWWPPATPPKKSRAKKIIIYFCVLTLILSLVINFYLYAFIVALRDRTMSESVLQDGAKDEVVAVYEVSGVITDKTAADFEMFFRLLRDRKDVKAVVLRVDSPGGYVGPSDQISRMVQLISEKYERPVVVSMGGVAASGGYYISAPADEILAEPTTITASIGVIMQFPVVHDWLKEHGLKVVTIRSSQSQRHKAALNFFEDPDPDMLRRRQKLLDAVHDKFVKVVRDSRGGKIKEKPASVTVTDFDGKEVTLVQTFPFDGQVLTAKAAEDVGLIDRRGYLDDAIKAAAKRAGLDDPRVVRFAKTRGLLTRMLSSADVEIPTGLDTKLLERYLSPRPMMIWEGQ